MFFVPFVVKIAVVLLTDAVMAKQYHRPKTLLPAQTHYCPGCGHGIAHRLVAEILDERGMRARTIGVAPVGCAVIAYDYLDIDMTEAAHGRTPAVATGIKRANPDKFVFTYQGDGDLAAIGTAETIHAANRGENITIVFINNAVYGMTSGQLAPTTLVNMKTSTSPTRAQPADGRLPDPRLRIAGHARPHSLPGARDGHLAQARPRDEAAARARLRHAGPEEGLQPRGDPQPLHDLLAAASVGGDGVHRERDGQDVPVGDRQGLERG